LLRGGQLGAACRRRGAVNALRDRALARAGCSILRLDAKLVMADIGAAAAAFAPEIERQRGA
jgi:very-short-patch-repair endonuclease